MTTGRREQEERAKTILEKYLPKLHWAAEPGSTGPDLMTTDSGGGRIIVKLKTLSTLRHEDLVGRLAAATLQLRRYAQPQDITVTLVTLPAITKSALKAARAFMNEAAPNQQWGLVGDDGGIVLELPALSVRVEERGERTTHGEPRRRRLFTDLNQWMLKVLLLRDADPRYWPGPRHPIFSAAELAEAAAVSTPHAYRFVRAFRDEDYLRESSDGLRVVRKIALFRQWTSALYRRRRSTVPVRWALGRPDSLFEVVEASPARGHEYAIGGFEACKAFSVLHTIEQVPEVHVKDTRTALEAWSLEETAQRDADFVLHPTRSESVFRGRVTLDRLRYVDILQAALDVASHPARGEEQANFIVDHVLGWTD